MSNELIRRYLCWKGVHNGKWGATYTSKSWTTSPEGVIKVTYYSKQDRYCSECNTYERREIETGTACHQPWHPGYAKEVQELEK